MTTKANRTKMAKAAERIEKAKKAYGIAEVNTDNFLLRLADSPVTMVVITVVCVMIVGLLLL